MAERGRSRSPKRARNIEPGKRRQHNAAKRRGFDPGAYFFARKPALDRGNKLAGGSCLQREPGKQRSVLSRDSGRAGHIAVATRQTTGPADLRLLDGTYSGPR